MAKMKQISKVRLTILVIVIASIFITFFDFPQIITWVNQKAGLQINFFDKLPYRLGLDLMGGTHLVYEANVSKVASADRNDAVEGVRDVIERRINAFGVAEPVVQVNKGQGKWRIIVELAGISDVQEAIKMIGETPLLEFKEQNTAPARQMTAQEKSDLAKFNADAKAKANKALTAAITGTDFAQVVKDYSEVDATANGGDIGWVGDKGENSNLFVSAAKTAVGKVYSEVITATDGYHIIKVTDKRDNGVEDKASHILICFKGATSCTNETTKEQAKTIIDGLKAKATPANFGTLAKENSTEPVAKTTNGDLGWFVKGQMVPAFENVVFPMKVGEISAVIETEFGYHIIYKTDERPKTEFHVAQVFVKTKTEADVLPPPDQWKLTGLTGKQLTSAKVKFDPQSNAPQVAIEFNAEGKQLFADITSRNVGKPVAIFLDGSPLRTPRVNEAIKEGKAVITGNFDVTEAQNLARRLNSGALPVPIELVTQQTVGASLGSASLQNSLIAVLIGYLLVILFMIGYYRLPGLLASFALLIYGAVVLFVFKAIPVTLSLSGLAGFILSVGMAVDANVLIFERFKEELKAGKPLEAATIEGFRRAWPSIRDGNYTTILTCIILYAIGTSSIKGFALTLTIGILVSMFSAIVITRTFMLPFTRAEKKYKSLWLFGINKKKAEGDNN